MYSFKTNKEPYSYPGDEEYMFAVNNPVECHNFNHLFPKVEINNKVYYLRGVERFMHREPWKQGERIGLIVAEVKEDEEPIKREATPVG